MPPHRYLRPIFLPAAQHLPPIPPHLLCSPLTHQHQHRRTTATLQSPNKPHSYAFYAGCATAAAFLGAALWLRPQSSTNATTTAPSPIAQVVHLHDLEEFKSELHKAFHEYLGCQNVRLDLYEAIMHRTASNEDVGYVADLHLQFGLFRDADAASGDGERTLLGLLLISRSSEERELVAPLRQILEEFDKTGVLGMKGKAVCFIGCKGVDRIWVYGKEGVEMEGADLRVWTTVSYLNALWRFRGIEVHN